MDFEGHIYRVLRFISNNRDATRWRLVFVVMSTNSEIGERIISSMLDFDLVRCNNKLYNITTKGHRLLQKMEIQNEMLVQGSKLNLSQTCKQNSLT